LGFTHCFRFEIGCMAGLPLLKMGNQKPTRLGGSWWVAVLLEEVTPIRSSTHPSPAAATAAKSGGRVVRHRHVVSF
jgi:hypothetical protein